MRLLKEHQAKKNENRETPFYSALKRRDLEKLKLLIKEKADIDLPRKELLTPLHLAGKCMVYSTIDCLLSNTGFLRKAK